MGWHNSRSSRPKCRCRLRASPTKTNGSCASSTIRRCCSACTSCRGHYGQKRRSKTAQTSEPWQGASGTRTEYLILHAAAAALGHKSIKTTVGACAGVDCRAACRHQQLVEQANCGPVPLPGQGGLLSPKGLMTHAQSTWRAVPRTADHGVALPWPKAWGECVSFAGFDQSGPASHLADATRAQCGRA